MLNVVSTQFLDEYCQAVAKAAGVEDASKQFNITPVMETKLRQAIVESDAFLNRISNISVDQSGNTYELTETDSGAHINWITMTIWANSGGKGQWMKLMNNAITRNFALDKLRIGFHGTSIAGENTDPKANPMGEDVNKGWLQLAKDKASAQVLPEVKLDSTGATEGSYRNLDSLVNDLINTTIHEVHQGDPDLVVLIGRNLVAAEQHRLLESAEVPTEHKAAQSLAKTVAGKTVYTPPFFPPNMIWVTNLTNLQILTQKGTQWRKSRNEEDRKRFETSYLRMEGYAVGNYHKFAAIEKVTVVEPVAV
ncbi:phage major capsid protein, P2 family [Vibrio sp. AND4]|uniref:phage major capsid protein, P2 family n=1 Tax=Vibrio sp. AND4 TaxID=314289 RepID=UPI00015EFEF1|nr:phage major capsid protein, P2 family [Vibrio sp. AND4]EDP59451.1 phage major capsid protein, P2 family [Vibrio sp. AND4]